MCTPNKKTTLQTPTVTPTVTPTLDGSPEMSRSEGNGTRRLTNVVWKMAKGVDGGIIG